MAFRCSAGSGVQVTTTNHRAQQTEPATVSMLIRGAWREGRTMREMTEERLVVFNL
jgi:hypothetical protein